MSVEGNMVLPYESDQSWTLDKESRSMAKSGKVRVTKSSKEKEGKI